MNERIKELYLHAFPPSLNDSTTVQISAEKFAELIIRECADKAHELIKSDGDEFPLQAVSYRIKQHFGVEE